MKGIWSVHFQEYNDYKGYHSQFIGFIRDEENIDIKKIKEWIKNEIENVDNWIVKEESRAGLIILEDDLCNSDAYYFLTYGIEKTKKEIIEDIIKYRIGREREKKRSNYNNNVYYRDFTN